MTISFSSFLAASLSMAVLICILWFVVSKTAILTRLGIYGTVFFLFMILLRAFIPADFYKISLTKSYYSYEILPAVYSFLRQPLFSVHTWEVSLEFLLQFVWAAGAVIFLGKKIRGYCRFKVALSRLQPLEKANSVYAIYQKAASHVFPGRIPECRIMYSNYFDTPAVFSQRKPVILLPTITYGDDELYCVILHELLHLEHKDFWVKCICDIIIAVYWWNPIISLVFPSIIIHILEIHVDYSLTRNQDKEFIQSYLNCLQKTLAHQVRKTPRNVHALVSQSSKKQILQRITLIIKGEMKKISYVGLLFTIILILLSFSFVFEPSYSPTTDEYGNPVFDLRPETSYVIRNGSGYDIYLNHRYFGLFDKIIEDFKDLPIYNSLEEVPNR